MNLAQLINEVYTITKRPDLVALTTMAIKAATLKCHTADFMFKDLYEALIIFPTESEFQIIDTVTGAPRYRNLKYFRPTNITSGVEGKFFELVHPQAVLDSYSCEKVNIFYQAGRTINIRSATKMTHGILGYYIYPDVTDSNWDSWISIEFPYAIVYEAAASVLKSVGYDQQAAGIKQLAGESLQECIAAGINETGE